MAENKEAPKAKKEKDKAASAEKSEAVVHVHTNRQKKAAKWNLEKCQKYARRFKTEAEWAQGSPSSYKSAQAHGWIAQCMTAPRSKPTIRKAG